MTDTYIVAAADLCNEIPAKAWNDAGIAFWTNHTATTFATAVTAELKFSFI